LRKLVPDFLNRPYALPLAGIVATLLVIVLLIQIPAVARARLAENLAGAGFKNAQIGSVSIRPSMVLAEGIKLDQYGFDEIKALSADINWVAFLATGKINGLTIQGVKLGRDATNIGPGSRQLLNTLLSLPHYRIRLTDLTLDITTDFGEIRLIAEAQVNSDDKPGERDIKAHIKAEQYQLVFDSFWEGVLRDNGQLDLTAAIEGGRLNAGPLRVSRFNGWAGAAAKDGQYEWQSQMEAGSASFMDVPLQKLSLVSAYSGGKTSVIFRSGVSGMSDILFTADLAKSDEADIFTANLSGKHLGSFLDYVEESTGRKKIIRDALLNAGEFSMVTRFEAEKRFVGGPLPFSLTLATDGAQSVEGNILFYPDTLDVRGSLETSTAMAQALQDYFKIPAANMRQNFIRLDGDARHFFYLDPGPSDAESEKDED
jgi:hypothetical protein